MGNLKSKVTSFMLDLIEDVYVDIAATLGLDAIDVKRDLITLRNRTTREGPSFLAKTLPKVGKHFDKCLLQGCYSPCPYLKLGKDGFPLLLRWAWSASFDANTRPEVVRAFRQLVYQNYKLELPYSQADETKVLNAFCDVDRSLPDSIDSSPWVDDAAKLIARVLSSVDPKDIIPKHGPGAVATGEKTWDKPKFSRIYSDLDAEYPFTEYFQLPSQIVDEWRSYGSLQSLATSTAKVVLVPKDSRGPRLISCEPLEKQWIQQGQLKALTSAIRSNRLSGRYVRFVRQDVNASLALTSSASGVYSTLDMKEASDRVSLALFESLMKYVPNWRNALRASRSTRTCLPDGTEVTLKKFAPMGSAVCFPIEALFFWALSLSAIRNHATWFNGRPSWGRLSGLVYVYGDDLVVHRSVTDLILQWLPTVGLLFNEDKCCTSGLFRESCGCDAFNGVDVTPVRYRNELGSLSTIDANTLRSAVDFSNRLARQGYVRAAWRIKDKAMSMKYRNGRRPLIPTGGLTSFSWLLEDGSRSTVRFNQRLHRTEVLQDVLAPVRFSGERDSWRVILSRINTRNESTEPGVYNVPRRNKVKRGWLPMTH